MTIAQVCCKQLKVNLWISLPNSCRTWRNQQRSPLISHRWKQTPLIINKNANSQLNLSSSQRGSKCLTLVLDYNEERQLLDTKMKEYGQNDIQDNHFTLYLDTISIFQISIAFNLISIIDSVRSSRNQNVRPFGPTHGCRITNVKNSWRVRQKIRACSNRSALYFVNLLKH